MQGTLPSFLISSTNREASRWRVSKEKDQDDGGSQTNKQQQQQPQSGIVVEATPRGRLTEIKVQGRPHQPVC